uniref:RB117 n=1 Tax=Ruegeria sp. PR1b TaxID=185588 RepID=Q8KWC5_9RHOB|nr:glycosyltransferase family A protein [Ruegeria sp. PR1b]AAN05138.1 RB117 [Ruegeria sp. PR1b]
MSLSVVIPVYNDAEGLTRLLRQIEELALFDAVLVCDDASDPPCRPADLGFDDAAGRISYLRSEHRRGAGHARNMGLDAVTTDHVLFFDSDDIFLPPLVALCDALAQEPEAFDFCLFRHVDSRERAKGVPGPMPFDQQLWERCGPHMIAPRRLEPAEQVTLAEIAAYPWNKIYRTAFLRETGITCTEIPVHNDIELHWASFLLAERVLVSAALCCEHIVSEGGDRLTNQRSAARLEVFTALDALHAYLPRAPMADAFLVPMVRFYVRLFVWIEENLDLLHHAAFRRRAAAFLLRVHDRESMTLIANRDPLLARDIVYHIREGRL